MPTFRMDFVVPDDLVEETVGGEPLFTEPVPHPTLERLRAALGRDSRWEFGRLTPLRPWGDPERQHLIVWVDITRTDAEEVLRSGVYDIVTNEIPGAILVGIMETSL